MNSVGTKIKKLRMRAKLSQTQLAEEVGSTAKSIQRYENDKCYPETYTLIKIAEFFGVPVDFLIESSGTIIRKSQRSESGLYRQYHARYLQCKSNYQIDSDKEYYWIYLDDDGTFGGQSEWVDWADKDRQIEVRKLRPVIPQNAIKSCTIACGEPMIINTVEDVDVFLIFGGHAIINADICRKYLPEFYEDYVGPNPERQVIDDLLRKS